MEPKSKIYRHKGDFAWRGIKRERYKARGKGEHWADIARSVLCGGENGENTRFHVRYFELAPGGFSSFERHGHEHFVIVVRGRGKVKLGGRTSGLDYLDSIYVAPMGPHQFMNPFDEPFGFLCIVDAERDKPQLLDGGESFCSLP